MKRLRFLGRQPPQGKQAQYPLEGTPFACVGVERGVAAALVVGLNWSKGWVKGCQGWVKVGVRVGVRVGFWVWVGVANP